MTVKDGVTPDDIKSPQPEKPIQASVLSKSGKLLLAKDILKHEKKDEYTRRGNGKK